MSPKDYSIRINNPAFRKDPDNERKVILTEDLMFSRELPGGGGIIIVVPEGYSTDFASIPAPLRAFIPPMGVWDRACIVHDYLCDQWKEGVTRFEADACFLVVARHTGVPYWKAMSMFLGIRFFSVITGKDWRV